MNNGTSLLVAISLIIIAVVIAVIVIKHRLKHKIEVITAFTGGLGSGKSFLSSQLAVKLYRKNLFKYNVKYLWFLFLKWLKIAKNDWTYEKPKLYSNIPLCWKTKGHGKHKRYYYSTVLTVDHLLLQEKLALGSVVYIDEVGSFASQFDYIEKNIIDVFDEFCRLFRHYVSNPALKIQSFMVVNDQCSENINLTIRRRMNTIHNLSNFYLLFGHIAFYYERMINISEEIKTIDLTNCEAGHDTQDNMRLCIRFFLHNKLYNSYCYHNRYNRVPRGFDTLYRALTKDDLMKCPRDKEKRYYQKTNKGGDY